MTAQNEWPANSEWVMVPTEHEVAMEQRYWAGLDAAAEYDAYAETQATLEDFTSWPTADLVEELELVRVLTPDQEDVIAELAAEIGRRAAVA